MTTEFLDNQICTFNFFFCRGVSHKNKRFWTIFLSAPKTPALKSEIFIFIVVSPSLNHKTELSCQQNFTCAATSGQTLGPANQDLGLANFRAPVK